MSRKPVDPAMVILFVLFFPYSLLFLDWRGTPL